MRSTLRATVMLFASALLIPVSTISASAAVVNDTPSTATPIVLGTTVTQDTRDAETEPLDAALNANCGAPAVMGSVWFTYVADGTEGAGVLVDGSATAYDLGFMAFEGDPAAGGTLLACGPLMVGVPMTEGQTYYVMAFTANSTDPVGGDLSVTFTAAPPSPTVSVTVDPRGTAYKDGSAQVTGTYSCTNGDAYSEIWGTLTQRVGRLKIAGDFYVTDLICDGETHSWYATATSTTGYFSGGKAAQLSVAYACGSFECTDGYAEQTIQLSRGKK